jgi:hypothetical protein
VKRPSKAILNFLAAAGKKGGRTRAKRLSPEQRREIARKAARARVGETRLLTTDLMRSTTSIREPGKPRRQTEGMGARRAEMLWPDHRIALVVRPGRHRAAKPSAGRPKSRRFIP